MPRTDQARRGSPFGRHDYEIAYRRLERSREVDISAMHARPLVVGEFFTLGREGRVYDVVVAEIRAMPQGGWRARCSLVDL